jgi:predicted amidohydrolase
VLDPSQKLRAKRDIGIRNGLVEGLEADIPAERALRVLDAGGKLVTPGLIDLHAHVYPYGSALGIPADELVPYQATTTMVSAGDAGANNFAANPARVIGRLPKLGTLQPGAPGDVSILEVVEGPVRFVDTRKNERTGKVHLRPVQAVAGGVPFGRPFHSPFSVR